MTFDWAEYLKVAQDLSGHQIDSASEEAKLRAAISRAYYAAFHRAREYYEANNQTSSVMRLGGSHDIVINWFRDHAHRRYWPVGEKLWNLKNDRVWADYRPGTQQNWQRKAEQVMDEAERIRKLVDAL